MIGRVLVSTCAMLMLAGGCLADGGKRFALIIGNDAYSMRPLQNAVSDARAMDRALRDAGFKTILKENASLEAMDKGVVELLENLGPDDTALFFYAGHAVQIESGNFLIPVDFQQASSIIDAKYKSFSMARALDEIKGVRHKRTIIILDSCRSNPVTDAQSLQAGLAMPTNAGQETYIAFSTSPGHVATDNPNGRNSYFTEALADLIGQLKDRDMDEIMTRVRSRVEVATEGKQTPWDQSSLTSKFYFHAQANSVAENDPTLTEKWMRDEKAREQLGDWDEALALLNQVVSKKPGGLLEDQARKRVPFVSARRDAQAAFEGGKYGDAAKAFQQAYGIDAFSIDSAVNAVNSYLLADDIDSAVDLIHSVRVRGSSSDVARAELVLKELSAVDSKADGELRAGVPAPPPIEDIFAGFAFGRVDTAAGQAFSLSYRPPIGPVLMAAVPAQNQTVAVIASLDGHSASTSLQLPEGVTLDGLHIEIIRDPSSTRDIGIVKDFGFVALDGPSGKTPVLVDGQLAALEVPSKVKLAPGKYEVRAVQAGNILSHDQIEIKPSDTLSYKVNH